MKMIQGNDTQKKVRTAQLHKTSLGESLNNGASPHGDSPYLAPKFSNQILAHESEKHREALQAQEEKQLALMP